MKPTICIRGAGSLDAPDSGRYDTSMTPLTSKQFLDLPNELLHHIVEFLPARELAAFGSVCRRTRACSLQIKDSVWEQYYKRDAGSDAHAAAQRMKPWDRLWRAMYGEIYPALRHPALTPPQHARVGDRVTSKDDHVREREWNYDGEYLVSEVLEVLDGALRLHHIKQPNTSGHDGRTTTPSVATLRR